LNLILGSWSLGIARRCLTKIVEIHDYRFPIATFLVPLAVRSFPEILAGPYPIGWDVVANYVPTTFDLAAGKVGSVELIGTSPLIYLLSAGVYALTGINPFLLFKIMGPLLYGSMAFSLYRFLSTGLRWESRTASLAVLFTSIYFVTLRLSWDLFRTMLGLTFIFLAIPLFSRTPSSRNTILLAILLVLAVASEQLTAVIVLTLVAARVGASFWKRTNFQSLRESATGFPALALFILIVYSHWITDGPLVQLQPVTPETRPILSSFGFFLFAYLPLLPFAILGARRVPSTDLRVWCYSCIAGCLAAFLPFVGLAVPSYRWSLLLDIPLCVYAYLGLRIFFSHARYFLPQMRFLRKRMIGISWMILAVSSLLYIALPAQQAFPFYTMVPSYMPSSLIQNTVPLADMHSVQQAVYWISDNVGPRDAVITHRAIYGWLRMFLPARNDIIDYGYSSPVVGLEMAQMDGYSRAFLIWWVDGKGWDGQKGVPAPFSVTFVIGNIAVFMSESSAASNTSLHQTSPLQSTTRECYDCTLFNVNPISDIAPFYPNEAGTLLVTQHEEGPR